LKANDGRLIVISGASRCGKSTYTARRVSHYRRVIAWDPEDQWSHLDGFRKISKRMELLDALKSKGRLKLAFVTGGNLKEEFDFLCKAVLYAGRFVEPLHFIAEELADVTTPAKAPGNWGILVRRGLKRGISIYAISQRWSEADKTAIGNASEYVCFASRARDIAHVSKNTGIEERDLIALTPFEFLQYDPVTKEKHRRKLRL